MVARWRRCSSIGAWCARPWSSSMPASSRSRGPTFPGSVGAPSTIRAPSWSLAMACASWPTPSGHLTSSSSNSTDPFGPGEALFTEAFYADCRARLRPGGILVAQSGNVFVERDRLDTCLARLGTVFRDTSFILTVGAGLPRRPVRVRLGFVTMRPSARFRPRSSRRARCRSACAATRRRCTPPPSSIRPG